MEDNRIVKLYWERSESAIAETASKYGRYCYAIAYNILTSSEDANESVNDTYLGAWNSMPPHRPAILSTFLGKITRRISIDKWREKSADKRGGAAVSLVLDELSECLPSNTNVEHELLTIELGAQINSFIRALPDTERRVFICRYWYLDPISTICKQFGVSQSQVKTMLYRTRKKLLAHLVKEGLLYDN